jgi:4-hydroxy-tetrahydrodipicolinate reductase
VTDGASGGGADPAELAVTGAGGRMSGAVASAAADRGDVSVALAVDRSEGPPVAGREVDPESDLPALLDAREPDVLVDFTAPAASVRYVEACADAGVAAVVGTTGFDDTDRAAIGAAATAVPVLRAANFARGLAALRRAVREAVAALPGYDVELTETHHAGKRDAPSGTARTLLGDVAAARGGDGDRVVHGREGEAPRRAGEVGVHARRAGDVTGEHELLIAGNREALTLTHRAGDRGVFAAGALDAAAWVAGGSPGANDFQGVLDDARN